MRVYVIVCLCVRMYACVRACVCVCVWGGYLFGSVYDSVMDGIVSARHGVWYGGLEVTRCLVWFGVLATGGEVVTRCVV